MTRSTGASGRGGLRGTGSAVLASRAAVACEVASGVAAPGGEASLHEDSRNSARHLLTLADFYADLSIEYVDTHPPESLTFDPAEFRDLVDSSARLYEMVASRDGSTEKLEGARRHEAVHAFKRGVDRHRFTT